MMKSPGLEDPDVHPGSTDLSSADLAKLLPKASASPLLKSAQ